RSYSTYIATLSLRDALPIFIITNTWLWNTNARKIQIRRPRNHRENHARSSTYVRASGRPAMRPTRNGRVPRRHHHQPKNPTSTRSEEHTSELQSRENLVCRL